jgi:NAD(P)-dependent dehydrogenase (short-subunit alcohol dehydrogenase family)
MKLLEGKVAIITGASRGIGSGIAKVFAQNGSNVAFTYSSSVESALALENELNALAKTVKKEFTMDKFTDLNALKSAEVLKIVEYLSRVHELTKAEALAWIYQLFFKGAANKGTPMSLKVTVHSSEKNSGNKRKNCF